MFKYIPAALSLLVLTVLIYILCKQAMLDLTVNRMLLNPDTVATISELVNNNENVKLELIFKLGLGPLHLF